MTTTHTTRPTTSSSDPASHRFPVAGPASPAAAPNAQRLAAAGPAVGLVELPDPVGVTLTSSHEVDAHLAEIETARQKQLDALPSFNRDTVTAAYRATVESILADVRAARARVAAGRYGLCTRCDGEIPAPRLERRPWVSRCTPCAQ